MSGIQLKIDRDIISYPGDRSHPNQFEIIATNTSQDWVMMQVKIYGKSNVESHDWYTVKPLVTAKEPPGSTTRFKIEVLEPPILGIEGNIPLFVEVFSVENKNISATQNINLKVSQPKSPIELIFDSPIVVYPDQKNQVLVRVRNRSSIPIEVDLNSDKIPSSWTIDWQNPKIKLFGKEERNEVLMVMVPEVDKTDTGSPYQCQIKAKPKIGEPIPEDCQFVVVPQGKIELRCQDKYLKISKLQRVEKRAIDSSTPVKFVYLAEYPIQITNETNSKQEIELLLDNIILERKNQNIEELDLEFLPTSIELDRGQSKKVKAAIEIGSNLKKKLNSQAIEFEIVPQLKLDRSQFPPTQGQSTQLDRPISASPRPRVSASSSPPPNITFKPNPLVLGLNPDSKWWLFLLGFLVLLAAFPIYQILFPKTHQNTVNSVSFINNGLEVLSGSGDREIFQWHVNSTPERLFNPNALSYQRQVASEDDTQSAVRVIRARAKSGTEEVVVAAGLASGDIQLWTLAGGEKIMQWSRKDENQQNDSVFDLQFLQDGRYLFSAHGSSFVRQWNIDTQGENTQLEKQIYLNGIPINALGITKSRGGKSLVVAGGRFNTLAFWDWEMENPRVYILDPKSIQTVQTTQSQRDFPLSYNRQHITSIAADEQRLVTADTHGFIKVWDMEVLRQCMNENAKPFRSRNKPIEFSCNDAALQWQTPEPGLPVRSVAMASPSPNSRCFYLASTGDDGKVMLRSFFNLADPPRERTIDRVADTSLNTVDLTLNPDRNRALIASDGKNDRVRLYYHPIPSHADCQ